MLPLNLKYLPFIILIFKIAVEIGKQYKENLKRVKNVASQAIGYSPIIMTRILKKGKENVFLVPITYVSERYCCYECRKTIESQKGFQLIINSNHASESFGLHYSHFQ